MKIQYIPNDKVDHHEEVGVGATRAQFLLTYAQ